jgi:tetratricopeptide (TPR) repeat protein
MQAHDEAIAIARELGAQDALAHALTLSGLSRMEQGDLAGARVQLEEALDLSHRLGDESRQFGKTANALGELERVEGNFARAQSLYEAALAQTRAQGDLRLIGFCLNNLAMTAIAQGSISGVRERLLEAMALDEEALAVSRYGRLLPLIACTGLAALRGDWEISARLEGAASFYFAQLGWPLDPADKDFVKSYSARTRAALGDTAFERSLALGRGLQVVEALAQMRLYLNREP